MEITLHHGPNGTDPIYGEEGLWSSQERSRIEVMPRPAFFQETYKAGEPVSKKFTKR